MVLISLQRNILMMLSLKNSLNLYLYLIFEPADLWSTFSKSERSPYLVCFCFHKMSCFLLLFHSICRRSTLFSKTTDFPPAHQAFMELNFEVTSPESHHLAENTQLVGFKMTNVNGSQLLGMYKGSSGILNVWHCRLSASYNVHVLVLSRVMKPIFHASFRKISKKSQNFNYY